MFTSEKISKRFVLFIALALLLGGMIVSLSSKTTSANHGDEITVFLPVIATDERNLPPPDGVAVSIQLPNALCPFDLSYNQHTDYLYITNEDSDNISIIKDDAWVSNLFVGDWPIHVRSDPNSNRTYVSTVVDGISVLNGTQIVNQIPPFHESYYITVNTVNGYTYITDLHEPTTILQGDQKIMDLDTPDYNGHDIVWQLVSDFDQRTGKTYFASWQHGVLSVVEDTAVTDQFEYHGVGAKDMVIDSDRGFIYLANFRPGEDNGPNNNLSIVNMATKSVFPAFTSQQSRHIALDPVSGIVYATNPKDDTVTILKGQQILVTFQVGDKPWDVTVDQVTGYAYVTNSEDNSISIFKDGNYIKTIELPENKGYQPWQITIDHETHDVYVINRSSFIEVYGAAGQTREVCEQPWLHILR